MFRSAASGEIAVNLDENGYLVWNLATNSKGCFVGIMNVRYSNDGFSDTIQLLLDEVSIGSFITLAGAQRGHGWNKFRSSGIVGEPVPLSAGQHKLKLIVKKADQYGVEIDKVIMNTSCIEYSSNITDYGQLSATDTGLITVIDANMPTDDTGITPAADDSAELAKIIIPPVVGVAGIVSTLLLGATGMYCKYKRSRRKSLQQITPPRDENNEMFPTGDYESVLVTVQLSCTTFSYMLFFVIATIATPKFGG